MKEIWKEVTGKYSCYRISNFGKLKSLPRKVKHRRSGFLTIKGKILNLFVSNAGYLCCHLKDDDDTPKTVNVHRLVALSFIGLPPSEKHQVNHKDGNKLNNVHTNLEWLTRKENSRHAVNIGLIKVGEDASGHKLSQEDTEKIKELYATGNYTNMNLARKFGVNWGAINCLIRGKNWKHLASDSAKYIPCCAMNPNGSNCRNFARAFVKTCHAHRNSL
jgi:hypothetical protein